jgi:hypothetical protein
MEGSSFASGLPAHLLSALSLLLGPFFLALILIFYSVRRGRSVALPLLPAIPLLLASVCIQATAAVLTMLNGFQGIADAQVSGPIYVFNFLIESEQSILWRVVEVAVCLLLVALLQIVRTARGTDEIIPACMRSTGPEPSLSIATVGWIAIGIVALCCLIWFAGDLAYICMLVIDSSKVAEAQQRFGDMGISGVSTYITVRLVLIALAGQNLAVALIAVGLRSMEDDLPRRRDRAFSAILIVFLAVCCVIGIAGGVHRIGYMRSQIAAAGGTPPSWWTGFLPFTRADAQSLLLVPPPPPPSDDLTAPPPAPPPPPPPPPPAIEDSTPPPAIEPSS